MKTKMMNAIVIVSNLLMFILGYLYGRYAYLWFVFLFLIAYTLSVIITIIKTERRQA